MKALFFDLVGGISGDMTLAALLDLGLSLKTLNQELQKIKVEGYRLKKSVVRRGHARAVKVDVLVAKNKNFSYQEIVRLVKRSRLSSAVKDSILKIYETLFQAEAKVHGHRHQDLKFHQIGDTDSVVDIVSVAVGLKQLGVQSIFYGPIPMNYSLAPATLEMLCGKEVYFTGSFYENVTPTGAAILAALGTQTHSFIKNTLVAGRCGYGAGSLDSPDRPNVLRLLEIKREEWEADEIFVAEANIDDMNPQFFDHCFDRLFENGALDVFLENITMKKTRPAFLLRVLSSEENLGKIVRLVLEETTTTGVRFYPVRRLKLRRQIKPLSFKGCRVRLKQIQLTDSRFRFVPEYDDCKRVAQKTKIPIAKIYQELKEEAEFRWRSQD